MSRPWPSARSVILVSAFLVPASIGPASAQESASFVMKRVTLAATGAVAASPSFEMRLTLGQAGPVGAVSRCNDGFHQSAGFWSVLGDRPVPMVLLVSKDPGNPGGVILSWSGSAPQFDLYRSSAAGTLLDPGSFVGSVFGCTTADLPPDTPRTYYQVVPTGP
jgi:hypothetical protein